MSDDKKQEILFCFLEEFILGVRHAKKSIRYRTRAVKFPGGVAVLCVVPSGLVLHIGITSCTFPPWTEMSKKNRYVRYVCKDFLQSFAWTLGDSIPNGLQRKDYQCL